MLETETITASVLRYKLQYFPSDIKSEIQGIINKLFFLETPLISMYLFVIQLVIIVIIIIIIIIIIAFIDSEDKNTYLMLQGVKKGNYIKIIKTKN